MTRLNSLICISFCVLLTSLGTLVNAQPLSATQSVDHTIYAELLNRYVSNGKVNYKELKKEELRLEKYLENLSSVNPAELSRNERFAFYINAYNAWTLKLILDHYPGIESIKDAGTLLSSPWKKKIARINGDVISLDTIEHDILRPVFKDPRVHFAINCAALSCPPLANYPFNGRNLDQQLNTQTRKFINDSKSNFIEGEILWVSRIFKWFEKDFDNEIIAFFEAYAEDELKQRLNGLKERINVKYLDYNWSLNEN